MWSSPDVGLFSNNVVSFSRNVVLRGFLFSLNVVPKPRMLSVRSDYVLSSLHLGIMESIIGGLGKPVYVRAVLLFGMTKVGRRLLHCKLQRYDGESSRSTEQGYGKELYGTMKLGPPKLGQDSGSLDVREVYARSQPL
jgi:hypothetical protein